MWMKCSFSESAKITRLDALNDESHAHMALGRHDNGDYQVALSHSDSPRQHGAVV